MSYILDALRKADAERDRGNVPGIHAQPSFGGAMPMRAQPATTPWLWLAVGALAVLIAGALGWYLISSMRSAGETAVSASASVPTPIATAPAPVAPATVAPAPAPVTAPPVQAAAPKPEATPAARKPRPTPPPSDPVAATADAKPAATGEKVYTLAELPDDIRRQLPAVSVGGSMYSPKAADRILIVNGQVLHEGDRIAPELTLQQIRMKAAVLSFKGYRYTIGF
ncbi:MAG: general secretion pathway protein GspB [Pseudomonadota bacterium]